MANTLPSRSALKAQARALRADMAARNVPLSHAQALETVAHQWGARDWNTLSALAPDDAPPPNSRSYAPGDRVAGRYLGHPFVGTVKAASRQGGGSWALTLRFDAPVDVVASQHFSNFRQQVDCTVGPAGHCARKTSDGMPHVILDA